MEVLPARPATRRRLRFLVVSTRIRVAKAYITRQLAPAYAPTAWSVDTGETLEYSRFEKARIIGARALQLSMGAPPLIEVANPDKMNPVEISMLEFDADAIPLTVRRAQEAQ